MEHSALHRSPRTFCVSLDDMSPELVLGGRELSGLCSIRAWCGKLAATTAVAVLTFISTDSLAYEKTSSDSAGYFISIFQD